jgi:hypothetical protein
MSGLADQYGPLSSSFSAGIGRRDESRYKDGARSQALNTVTSEQVLGSNNLIQNARM